ESLFAYVGDKSSNNYRALVRLFEPAEMRLEADMAKEGLQRWGSTWVTAEQLAAIVKYQADLDSRMTRLEDQYQSAKDTLASLENQIAMDDVDLANAGGALTAYTGQVLMNL